LYAVTYAGGLFVAVGYAGVIQTSPDGVTWTARTPASGTDNLSGICHTGTNFVAVGNNGSGRGVAEVSSDGSTWTQHLFPVAAGGQTAVCYGGTLLSVGADASVNTTGVVYTSSDQGSTWTLQNSFLLTTLLGVTYIAGRYVVCTDTTGNLGGYGTHPALVISGLDPADAWTYIHGPSAQEAGGSVGGTLYGITNNGVVYTVVGSGGTIAISRSLA
jgi:hypothetical protein